MVRRIIERARRRRGAPPPLQRAAVQRVNVDEGSAGQRLDNFLLRLLKGVPKTHVYRVIRSGEVRVNTRPGQRRHPAARWATRCACRRCAWPSGRPRRRRRPASSRSSIEDEQLIAVDKPAGVAVHGGSGVSFGVIEQLRRARPQARFLELVHRLDKQTSGVLLLAKKRSALTALQDQFRARDTDKTYAALVIGAWPASQQGDRRGAAQVDRRPTASAGCARWLPTTRQAAARSRWSRWRARCEAYTLLDVTIKTGRTHQIRVHLAHEGHPIVGDDKYGDFEFNRQLARGEGLRRRALRRACSCMRGGWPSTTRPAARASSSRRRCRPNASDCWACCASPTERPR